MEHKNNNENNNNIPKPSENIRGQLNKYQNNETEPENTQQPQEEGLAQRINRTTTTTTTTTTQPQRETPKRLKPQQKQTPPKPLNNIKDKIKGKNKKNETPIGKKKPLGAKNKLKGKMNPLNNKNSGGLKNGIQGGIKKHILRLILLNPITWIILGGFLITLTIATIALLMSGSPAPTEGTETSTKIPSITIEGKLNTETDGTEEEKENTTNNANLTEKQKKVIDVATNSTDVNLTPNMCLAFIDDVFSVAGTLSTGRACCATESMDRSSPTNNNLNNIPVGACVYTRNSWGPVYCGTCGKDAGHIGIYVGDGKIIDNIGGRKTTTLEQWKSNVESNGGTVSWGWHYGNDLTK